MYYCGMSDAAARAILFHGLSDPSRLALIDGLIDGPRRVNDLVALTGMGQPSVSKHLACLWDCGLVEREQRGREVHYRLSEQLGSLLAAADALLVGNGDRIRACPRYGRVASWGNAA
jgi:ArsR family transcriptional regulator, cadmium/lead-responsive transcriptional repressor